MAKVIACANQKGGVGKTTTSVNLAAALQSLGHATLLIDMDPQGNATMGSGAEKNQLSLTVCDVLLGECRADEALIVTEPMHFSLLPANRDLTRAEVLLLDRDQRERYLKNIIDALRDDYAYIIIDCPPSLNMLTVNSLVAADSVLIPVQCEYYSLEGLADLQATISSIAESANTALEIEGILRTMYDGRNRLTLEVSDQLEKHFEQKLYRTVIPRNVRVAEAPSYGMPVLIYDKKSQGAAAYQALAGELVRNQSQISGASQQAAVSVSVQTTIVG